MANTMSFEDLSIVLKSIVDQATGKTNTVATDTSSFVAQAQTALLAGYDPLATAVSQVLSKTVFSNRAYKGRLAMLQQDNIAYGNHVRKLNYVDQDPVADEKFNLEDGKSIDQYEVKKPKVLQTNFYGGNTYSRFITIYRQQLENAFTGPEQLGSFLSFVMTGLSNQIEQDKEELRRATIANFIGAKNVIDGGNVIHLVTVYNGIAGTQLTSATVMQPENFAPFARWLFGFIKTISQNMQDRSQMYHVNLDAGAISRHTPVEDQRLLTFAPTMNIIDSSVLSTTYNDEYLKMLPHESVTFWQGKQTPGKIDVTPSYTALDGSVGKGARQQINNVFGVLYDWEAMGVTLQDESMDTTPYNARGKYYNQFAHYQLRTWNDLTENAIVLCLD